MKNCCDINVDGMTIIGAKLHACTIEEASIYGGTLTGSKIGRDCNGEVIAAGDTLKLVTCPNLDATMCDAKDAVEKELQALKSGIETEISDAVAKVNAGVAEAVSKVNSDITGVSSKVDAVDASKQGKLKDKFGNDLNPGAVVAMEDEVAELTSKVDAIHVPEYYNCNGEKLANGERVASCYDLGQAIARINNSAGLVDELGNSIKTGTQVYTGPYIEETYQRKLTKTTTTATVSAAGSKLPTSIVGDASALLGIPTTYLVVTIGAQDYLIPAYAVPSAGK